MKGASASKEETREGDEQENKKRIPRQMPRHSAQEAVVAPSYQNLPPALEA